MDDWSPSFSDQSYDVVASTPQKFEDLHKRDHHKRLAMKLSPGQVAFRFLIHVSATRGLLGQNGAAVARIRRETAAVVHCEAAAPGSYHRVVLVVGSGWKAGRDVSSAQEAMLRVFERVWELAVAESETEEVWWKMVAHKSQIGPVVGKGGKNIKRVSNESGAHVRILPAPDWTVNDYELIQITGVASAVKKALVDVSNCLQDCPASEKSITPLTRNLGVEASADVASPDPHAEIFSRFSSLGSPEIGSLNGNTSTSSSIRAEDGGDYGQDKKGTQQEEVFRMLCTNHAAGWVIGKRGSIVRALQNQSGASIKFAPPLTESGERVVTISAQEDLESSYSPAQKGVILLFSRIIEGVAERGYPQGSNEVRRVMAKLLVASDLAGCLGSNDGVVLSAIREVTGADIWVLEREHTQNHALLNDVVVKITGEYKSVQNALFQVTACLRDSQGRARKSYGRVSEDPLGNDPVPHNIGALSSSMRMQLPQIRDDSLVVKRELDVSTCLQDCPSLGKASTGLTGPLGYSNGAASDPHEELFSHLSSWSPPSGNSENSASNANTVSSLRQNDEVVSGQDTKGKKREVVFRMLCSDHAAGSVIGKKGAIVRALQNEAGASISFASGLTESRERVITISAWENLESEHSPAQNAVGLVFRRIIEGVTGRGYQSGVSEGRPVTAKLLIASDLAGFLGGNDGRVLSEMRQVTGADIWILEGERIRDCASWNDVVVQITGEYKSVQNALFQVTRSLRDKFLPGEVFREVRAKPPYGRVNDDPLRNDPFPHRIDALSSRTMLQMPQNLGRERCLTTFGKDLELESGNKLATVTNTTVELMISGNVFGSVYGEDGTNLDQIIQISGAKVEVHDPRPGEREGRVIISGTPDKTLAAQSLLQAFIQSAGKTP